MRELPNSGQIRPAFEEMREPRNDSYWGLFVHEDEGPTARGFFCWHETQSQLIEFVYRFPLFWESADTSTADPEDAQQRYEAIDAVRCVLEKCKTGGLDEAALKELNLVLRGSFFIAWAGQFSDLKAGGHPYALRLRARFSKTKDDSGPIGPDQVRDFVSFLRYSWGDLHDRK